MRSRTDSFFRILPEGFLGSPRRQLAVARAPEWPLLLLVGVEDRGDALGIGGERLDAGALDLQ